jgi:hypothetical protein
MKFNEWLRIDELSSMSQIDSSGVELEKSGNNYRYRFDDFIVGLNRDFGKKVGDKMVDGIWIVDFMRDGRWILTGKSGSDGTAVYGKVLAAVKKLMEVEKVNGLSFSGAEARQDIMYDKFLKALGGFTPVGGNVYIRDEIVKANASEKDLEYYRGAGEKMDNQIYNLKVAKAASRNKGLIGKITGYSDSDSGRILPAIIMEITASLRFYFMVWDGARLLPQNVYSSLYHSSDELRNVVSPSLINPILLSSLVDFAKSNKSHDQDWKDIDIENDFIPVDLPDVDGSTYDFGFKKETA